MNKIIITGNICKDAELKVSSSSKDFIEVRMGVRDRFRKEEYGTMFISCFIFGEQAKRIVGWCIKGRGILVSGRLDISEKEYEGVKQKNVCIFANDIEFLEKKRDSDNNNESDYSGEEQ